MTHLNEYEREELSCPARLIGCGWPGQRGESAESGRGACGAGGAGRRGGRALAAHPPGHRPHANVDLWDVGIFESKLGFYKLSSEVQSDPKDIGIEIGAPFTRWTHETFMHKGDYMSYTCCDGPYLLWAGRQAAVTYSGNAYMPRAGGARDSRHRWRPSPSHGAFANHGRLRHRGC